MSSDPKPEKKIKFAFLKKLTEKKKEQVVAYIPYLIAELFPLPFKVPRFTDPNIPPRVFVGLMPDEAGIEVTLSRSETIVVLWSDVLKILQREKGMVFTKGRAIELCQQMAGSLSEGERSKAAQLTRAKKGIKYVKQDGTPLN